MRPTQLTIRVSFKSTKRSAYTSIERWVLNLGAMRYSLSALQRPKYRKIEHGHVKTPRVGFSQTQKAVLETNCREGSASPESRRP